MSTFAPLQSKLPRSNVIFIDAYKLNVDGVIVDVNIFQDPADVVPNYVISILNISPTTQIILDKMRDEFVTKINVGAIQISAGAGLEEIRIKFKEELLVLIQKYFPTIDEKSSDLLITHVIQQNIGLGNIEIPLKDSLIEEVVVNNAADPAWVYHRKHGWLKTNIAIGKETRVRHYATMIGRDVGKEITLLKPLMDAYLKTGDRVNATLNPISTKGNTITIRKFAEKPWSIVSLINSKTMSYGAAAWIWLAIQHELSMVISGGTASGKTSTLNAIANFFPPNHRIISIEDTRELTLPKTLHWVPMETRLPNPEGKGEVTMLDLLVNSLRMRPDRIIMGEIRRKEEAQVLFEAMHTGHSVYATLHANNAHETMIRLTNPPIDVPKIMLGVISMILVQNRNRRTGKRRTLQLAEMLPTGDPHVLMQLDFVADHLKKVKDSVRMIETIELYTGMKANAVFKDLQHKIKILRWLVARDLDDVHKIGWVMARYYQGRLKI